jgi:hypothetical protein
MHPQQARKYFKRALEILKSSSEVDGMLLVRTYNGLATCEFGNSYGSKDQAKHLDEAQRYANISLDISQQILGPQQALEESFDQRAMSQRRAEITGRPSLRQRYLFSYL